MLIEVLSPSTEAFNRGEKFTRCKSIESFTEYILIGANRSPVTQFIKRSEREWIQREAVGLEGKLTSLTFNIEILLSEICLDVEFSAPAD